MLLRFGNPKKKRKVWPWIVGIAIVAVIAAEWSYIGLTEHCGWKAQDARDILPIDTKSVLVHSAFIDDWKHFFDLRAKGTTGAPHPQAKELAEPLMKEFEKRGLL